MIFRSSAACISLALLAITGVQAATVILTPSSSTVTPGDSLTINVSGSDFEVPTGGATLGVEFNLSILSLDSVTLSASSPFDDVSFNRGEVSVLAFSDVSGDFAAFDMHFTALEQGTTAVSLIDEVTTQLAWFDANAEPIPGIVYEPAGGAAVNVVPLPAAMWTMLSALGLLGLTARRRTQSTASEAR